MREIDMAHSSMLLSLKIGTRRSDSVVFGDEWKLASERIPIQPRAPASGLGGVKQKWGWGSTQNGCGNCEGLNLPTYGLTLKSEVDPEVPFHL